MNDNDKYFVPEIEDFHIGYEFEFQGVPKGWHKMIFSEENSLKNMRYNIEKLKDAVRVSYLSQEQIENEGWMNFGSIPQAGMIHMKKDTQYDPLLLSYHMNTKMMIIETIRDVLFSGECKSINEFRYICKLLKI